MTCCLCSLAVLVVEAVSVVLSYLYGLMVSTILIMVRMYIQWSSDGTMAHGALSGGG